MSDDDYDPIAQDIAERRSEDLRDELDRLRKENKRLIDLIADIWIELNPEADPSEHAFEPVEVAQLDVLEHARRVVRERDELVNERATRQAAETIRRAFDEDKE